MPTADQISKIMEHMKELEKNPNISSVMAVVQQLEGLGVHVEGSTKLTGFAEMEWTGALMLKELKLGSVAVKFAIGH